LFIFVSKILNFSSVLAACETDNVVTCQTTDRDLQIASAKRSNVVLVCGG